MRLKYHYPLMKTDYLAVAERQKRGAIHFHVVLFDVPKIPLRALNEIWGHGFVKINKIKGIEAVGAYVCKYLSKDLEQDEKKSSRRYTTSRGLKEPEITLGTNSVLEKKIAESIATASDCLTYQSQFESEYYDTIKYSAYILKSQ